MKALAIDSSGVNLLLALSLDGELVVRREETGRKASRDVLPGIVSLLEEAGIALADLDLLIYAKGPGSFTGLRIAVGVVQGLAFGLDVPVVPVSTLACLARGAARRHQVSHVFSAQHARADELFHGIFAVVDGHVTSMRDETMSTIATVETLPDAIAWSAAGSAMQFREEIEASLGITFQAVSDSADIEGEDLVAIGLDLFADGRFVDALSAQPEYLREEVASRNP